MPKLTRSLRDEHAELLPHVEALRGVADAIGLISAPGLREQVARVEDFFTGHLIPHAMAEDAVLYPAVARVMGAPEATATMSRDHEEVVDLVEQLKALEPELAHETIGPDVERALRRILYGLYALVKVHFEKEEEVYLPLLDERLAAGEALDLFEALEAAAAKAKAGV